MANTQALSDRVRVNVWILKAQDEQLKQICELTGLSKTDAIAEALQYWLATQRKMLPLSAVHDGI